MQAFVRQFWTGSTLLDKYVCLAVNELGQSKRSAITARTCELLVAAKHVDGTIQFLPDEMWVGESLERLVEDGKVVKLEMSLDIFAPAKTGAAD